MSRAAWIVIQFIYKMWALPNITQKLNHDPAGRIPRQVKVQREPYKSNNRNGVGFAYNWYYYR